MVADIILILFGVIIAFLIIGIWKAFLRPKDKTKKKYILAGNMYLKRILPDGSKQTNVSYNCYVNRYDLYDRYVELAWAENYHSTSTHPGQPFVQAWANGIHDPVSSLSDISPDYMLLCRDNGIVMREDGVWTVDPSSKYADKILSRGYRKVDKGSDTVIDHIKITDTIEI